jgi:hypothetical protein
MTRLPAWPGLLDRFISENRHRHFAYGSFDCCLWVCDCIQVMTGVDVAAEFRGRYNSRTGALRRIREVTGASSVRKVVEHVTAAQGMVPAPVLNLGRGDVGLIRRSRDYSLGIVALDAARLIVAAASGLEWIPLTMATAGWRV